MTQGKKIKSAQILDKGHILNSPEEFVIAENLVICKVAGGIIQCCLAFIPMNYAFMFKYPSFSNNFCLFIQKPILKIDECTKFPNSIITLIK